jgi:hypothetical protein
MTDTLKDTGIIQTLVERLSNQRLPRALDLKAKVDAGEKLSDYDLKFLEEVFADAQHIRPLVERHPEYQELAAKMVGLYKEIMDKAMENEPERWTCRGHPSGLSGLPVPTADSDGTHRL